LFVFTSFSPLYSTKALDNIACTKYSIVSFTAQVSSEAQFSVRMNYELFGDGFPQKLLEELARGKAFGEKS